MEFTFDLQQHLATLSDSGKLSTELNIISYSGTEPRYDLRRWRQTRNGEKRMQKGLTMNAEELRKLRDILNAFDI